MLFNCHLHQHVGTQGGALHPSRPIVASGVGSKEVCLRNYRMTGKTVGRLLFN